jgi:AraC-like DNA-binding protein
VEFYLDLGGERAVLESDSLRQFVAAADGRAYGGRLPIWFGKNHVPVGVDHARIDSGYRLVMSVAWADIGLAKPRAGDTLGFDLSNFDRDSKDGLVSMGTWAGNHLGNHHNASEWGILVLADKPARHRLVIAAILVVGAVAAAGLLLARTRRHSVASSAETVQPEATKQLFDRNAVSSLTAAALDIVDRDYGEESCNLEYVATRLRRTPKHISAVFRKETGMRFTDYLNEVRLLAADHLLRTTRKTAFDLSIEVGYHSYEYFSRTYKKRFGISPSKAREAHGMGGA